MDNERSDAAVNDAATPPEKDRARRLADEAVATIDESLAEFEALSPRGFDPFRRGADAEKREWREKLARWIERTERRLSASLPVEAKRFEKDVPWPYGTHSTEDLDRYTVRLKVLRDDLRNHPEHYFPPEPPTSADTREKSMPVAKRVVFIVHGHDEANALKLERRLKDLKVNPTLLAYVPGQGRTIIEKFEQEASPAAYAVVLLSSDDLVSVQDGEETYRQARPNVFFELGWFYGCRGRGKAALVAQRGGRIPSDLEGVERIEFTSSVDEVFYKIEAELQAAGVLQPARH